MASVVKSKRASRGKTEGLTWGHSSTFSTLPRVSRNGLHDDKVTASRLLSAFDPLKGSQSSEKRECSKS